MTKEEKLALATIVAEAVVKALKEANKIIDGDTVGNIVEKSPTANIHQSNAETECKKIDKVADMKAAEVNDFPVKNTRIGLMLYGADACVLHYDFIRSYSSGKLDSYDSCSCFLKLESSGENSSTRFDKQNQTNPAHFTYIELSTSVVNPLFIQNGNNILSILLDIPVNDLKAIINYEKYVITKSNEQYWNINDIISPKQYYELTEQNFKVELATGGEAIKHLLSNFDISTTLKGLKDKYSNNGKSIPQKIQKRIDVLGYFINHNMDVQNIMISILPVPQVEVLLKNATKQTQTEIKKLYLYIAALNERVICLENIKSPTIVINNEKRMLQEAVDRLFRKCLKVYLCHMNMFHINNDEFVDEYLLDENKEMLLSLLEKQKGYDVYVWVQFVAMLFCMEIRSDIIDSSAFYDFLWENNTLEDKDI